MTCAADIEIARDVKFMKWIGVLEAAVQRWGNEYGEGTPPYSLPLIDGTGLECWHQLFEDGYSPEDAFAEDRSNWDAY